MPLVLYYGSGSPYAWRVQLALEHKAVPYELKVLSFSAGDTRKPDFVALNPRHRVATICLHAIPASASSMDSPWRSPHPVA